MKKAIDSDYYKDQESYSSLDLVLLKRLFTYLSSYRWGLVLALFFLLLSKGIEAVVPLLIGKISQQILDHPLVAESNHLLFSTIAKGCFFILGLLFFSYLLDAINVLLKTLIGQKALFKLRAEVYDHIQKMPMEFYNRQSIGHLMTRTIHDVDQIDQMFTESIVPIIGSGLLFIGMLIGIFSINWHVGLIVCLFLPLVWWLANNFRVHQRHCFEILRAIVSGMNHFVQEYLMGSSIIRAFGLQKKEKKKFEKINEDYRLVNLENIRHFSFFIAAIEFTQNVLLVLIFVVLVAFSSQGFQVGNYFTFSLYALMFFRPLGDLAERYNVLQSAMAAAQRIFHILDQPIERESSSSPKVLENVEEIAFEDVWFAYQDDQWILRGFWLSLKKGESIALVGMTGAGKTTILSLLLRFYDYQKGSIKINGIDLREYNLESVRKQFSLVLQDPVIFSGTIGDNITLYHPEMNNHLESVVHYVNLQAMMERFPEGLNHRLQERGTNLSLGEMQLISMARAVAQQRAIFLFDEATANIDMQTEKLIQEALEKIFLQKTAIVIAHRLSTIQYVSRIVVMHQGVVRESGTHQQLLQLGGLYEKLYRLQFV